MTAQEIRGKSKLVGDAMTGVPVDMATAEMAIGIFAMVAEIAAQLAQLNETLSVFNNVRASSGGGLCTSPEA